MIVLNPRQRARLRLKAFFEREHAPTQAEFAAKLGHQQTWVHKLLSTGPLLKDLDALAKATGLSLWSLVAPVGVGVSDPEPAQAPTLTETAMAIAEAFDQMDAKRQAGVIAMFDACGYPIGENAARPFRASRSRDDARTHVAHKARAS